MQFKSISHAKATLETLKKVTKVRKLACKYINNYITYLSATNQVSLNVVCNNDYLLELVNVF